MDIETLIVKIVGILIKEGHNDKRFKLGDCIRYMPTEVGDILRKHAEELMK